MRVHCWRFIALLLFCTLALACGDRAVDAGGSTRELTIEARAGASADSLKQPASARRLDYVTRVLGGAQLSERLPLLVVLHGLGDTPEHFIEVYEGLQVPVRVVAVRAPDPWGEGTSWYSIDAPVAEKSPQIVARAQEVSLLIEELEKTTPTRGKAIVSGFSQGGVLSFALASYHADRLLAALPIAGSLPEGMPANAKPAPGFTLLAFHGEKDVRIPFADGKATFERLRRAGYEGTFSSFAGVGHGIPEAMHAQITAALQELLTRAAREP